jgi:hypothetical protein
MIHLEDSAWKGSISVVGKRPSVSVCLSGLCNNAVSVQSL